MSQGSILSTWHIGRWPHSDGRWPLAMEDDKLNKWVLNLDMKTKVACHVPRININHLTHRKMTYSDGRWPLAMEDYKDDKLNKWFFSLDMKTKVFWHVPRININSFTSIHVILRDSACASTDCSCDITWGANLCSIHFEIASTRSCLMKGSLCPRETFHYEDFNGTKNSTEKLILQSLMTWQRLATAVGVFSVCRGTVGKQSQMWVS